MMAFIVGGNPPALLLFLIATVLFAAVLHRVTRRRTVLLLAALIAPTLIVLSVPMQIMLARVLDGPAAVDVVAMLTGPAVWIGAIVSATAFVFATAVTAVKDRTVRAD